jgi:2-polyprenyl-3-methyl-5-hydroxy-6-metoxy-1,4-benzoquinol methylase
VENYSEYQIIKDGLGYMRVDPLPSEEELENYYANSYYQNPHGTYQSSYSEIESTQRKLRIELIHQAVIYNLKSDTNNQNKILDLGCGEGFLLSHFKDAGWKVLGLDFSDEGVRKQNPKLIKDIVKGNVYKELEVLLKTDENYDVIYLGNILEHVIDPLALVTKCSDLLSAGGLLVITVPNDFSILQSSLITSNVINREYWICPPDHLNYFSLESLVKLQVASNLKVLDSICDFPIEWFLMNNHSNYINDPTVGKSAHLARARLDSLINSNRDSEMKLNFWRSMAALGFGRTITTFSKKIS